MAQVRIVGPTSLKVGLAYLRWGPIFVRRNRPLDPETAARMAQALEDVYVVGKRAVLRI